MLLKIVLSKSGSNSDLHNIKHQSLAKWDWMGLAKIPDHWTGSDLSSGWLLACSKNYILMCLHVSFITRPFERPRGGYGLLNCNKIMAKELALN